MMQNFNNTDTESCRGAIHSERWAALRAALAVTVVASLVIFSGLSSEPHFADESAMIAQSYYYTLFKARQCNHPDWLHYAAFDHPPLPKYLFGLSLDLAGLPTPTSIEAWVNWVRGDFSPPRDPRVLFWARVPAALFGVGGALAIFSVGYQMHGRLVGILASLLLTLNPLYLTHARRAMSDSFTECLVIAAVAVGLWGSREMWRAQFRFWRWFLFAATESVLCGLAALAKLNGGIATAIVLGMLGCCWISVVWFRFRGTRPCQSLNRWNLCAAPVAAFGIGVGSFLLFLNLNPFLTAHPNLGANASGDTREIAAMGPIGRARFLVRFRREWSQTAIHNTAFQKDWLRTTPERLRMTVWDGFGRYSTLGPRDILTKEPRPEFESFFEYRRASCLVWFPLLLWGFGCVLRDGWQAMLLGQVPIAWEVALYTIATVALVVWMIPLNWDRYYLPLQAPAALLVSFGVLVIWRWLSFLLNCRKIS